IKPLRGSGRSAQSSTTGDRCEHAGREDDDPMGMRLSGTTTVPAGRAELRGALDDPRMLEGVVPVLVDVEDDRHLSAIVEPATGLGVTPIGLAFELAGARVPDRVRIDGTGTGGECAVRFTVDTDGQMMVV